MNTIGMRGRVDQRRASNIAMAGLGGLGEPKWLRVTSVYSSLTSKTSFFFFHRAPMARSHSPLLSPSVCSKKAHSGELTFCHCSSSNMQICGLDQGLLLPGCQLSPQVLRAVLFSNSCNHNPKTSCSGSRSDSRGLSP